MASNKPLKGQTYSSIFEKSQKQIEPDCRVFDEMVDATLLAISKEPSLFDFVDTNGKVQVVKARVPSKSGEVKRISIYFIDMPDTIYLVDIIENPSED